MNALLLVDAQLDREKVTIRKYSVQVDAKLLRETRLRDYEWKFAAVGSLPMRESRLYMSALITRSWISFPMRRHHGFLLISSLIE